MCWVMGTPKFSPLNEVLGDPKDDAGSVPEGNVAMEQVAGIFLEGKVVLPTVAGKSLSSTDAKKNVRGRDGGEKGNTHNDKTNRWNIRGLNDPLKQKEDNSFIRLHELNLCDAVETKIRNENLATTIARSFPHRGTVVHNPGSNSVVAKNRHGIPNLSDSAKEC